MATTLVFSGHIVDGQGDFSKEIVVPGARASPVEISGWPERVEPGTLNFKVSSDGFPAEYLHRFGSASVRHLDSRRFLALAELPASALEGNTLPPTNAHPEKGIAQLWRATITTLPSNLSVQCWVLRRIGSGYTAVLECVADRRLRDELKAPKGVPTPAQLVMEGSWRE